MYVVMLTDSPSTTPNLYGGFETRADAEDWVEGTVQTDEYEVIYVRTTEEWEDE